MGKQIYFTDEELQYIKLVFANIDAVQDEDEGHLRDNVYEKVSKATK